MSALSSLYFPAQILAVSLLIIISPGCSDDETSVATNSQELVNLLSQASSGDVINLSTGNFTGPFSVPAGITVQGANSSFNGDGAIFRLVGGDAQPTRLTNLSINSTGVAILANGGGEVLLDEINIVSTTGVGVATENLTNLTMENVSFDGPVTEADLNQIGGSVDARETSIAGLIVSGGNVELDGLQINNFAGFGAVLFDTSGTWSNSAVNGVVGTSILAESCSLEMTNVTVNQARTGRKLGENFLSIGLVASAGTQLTTSNLQLLDGQGIGLLQDASVGEHTDLQVRNNNDTGVWVQNNISQQDITSLRINGTASNVDGNKGVAIFARDTTGIELDGVNISNTRLQPQIVGISEVADVGDGIQLVGTSGQIELRNLLLNQNDRIGLLLDGTQSQPGPSPVFIIDQVTINGPENEGEAFGFLTQNGAAQRAELLEGITIDDDLDARDIENVQVLEITATTDIPTVGLINEDGLIGENGLINEDGRIGENGQVGPKGLINEDG